MNLYICHFCGGWNLPAITKVVRETSGEKATEAFLVALRLERLVNHPNVLQYIETHLLSSVGPVGVLDEAGENYQ